MLLLPEGQAGEVWKLRKQCCCRIRMTSDRKLFSRFRKDSNQVTCAVMFSVRLPSAVLAHCTFVLDRKASSLECLYHWLYRWSVYITGCIAGVSVSLAVSLECLYHWLYRWSVYHWLYRWSVCITGSFAKLSSSFVFQSLKPVRDSNFGPWPFTAGEKRE